MTDTERLNLTEHYKWCLEFTKDRKWSITGSFGYEIGESLREAIDNALTAQIKWSTE